jgi:methionine synthase II (cobalamin-independent)
VTAALDFTFEFDLPVLFTLPSLGQEHFMGFDVASLMGILDGVGNKQRVQLKSHFYRTGHDIVPFNLSEFLMRQNGEAFKYQLVGPYTFYKMLDKPILSFEQFCNFLIPYYKKLIKMLQKEGMSLFSLDEPMFGGIIKEGPDFLILTCRFIRELESKNCELSIHICSDIPSSLASKIPAMLNLDYSILSHPKKGYMNQTNIFGFSEGLCNLQDFVGANSVDYLEDLYISPACGLYGLDEKNCYRVLSNLRMSKELLIAPENKCT